jgi:hypothetical protein
MNFNFIYGSIIIVKFGSFIDNPILNFNFNIRKYYYC